MSEKRFIVEYGENNLPFFVDLEEHRDMSIKEVVDLLNEMFEKLNKKQEKSVELFFKYKKLKEENEQLRMKLKGDDYIMVSEMLSNLRKTGICDGCKNKDKPVEWYLERGFSITGQICDRYEPEV